MNSKYINAIFSILLILPSLVNASDTYIQNDTGTDLNLAYFYCKIDCNHPMCTPVCTNPVWTDWIPANSVYLVKQLPPDYTYFATSQAITRDGWRASFPPYTGNQFGGSCGGGWSPEDRAPYKYLINFSKAKIPNQLQCQTFVAGAN